MARDSLYNLGKPGEKVLLEGTLVYSALKEKKKLDNPTAYDQDALYRITIADPKVVKGGDSELGKHVLDEDITHGTYESKKGKFAGHKLWSFNSKSKYPINIYTKKTKGDKMTADKFLKNELASGQPVGILFSLYSGTNKMGQKYVSGSLDGVVLDDPDTIKYLGEANGEDYSDFLGAPTGTLNEYASGSTETSEEPNTDAKPASSEPKATESKDDDSKATGKMNPDELF